MKAQVKQNHIKHDDGIGERFEIRIESLEGELLFEGNLNFPMFQKSDFINTQGKDALKNIEKVAKDFIIKLTKDIHPELTIID